MANILFAGDIHLLEKDLVECDLVLKEIAELIKKHNVQKLILTGDTFDVIKPSSKELDLFSNFVKEINIPVIMLSANSHESSSFEDSVCNHFAILNKNITVVKNYSEDDYLYVGHFIVNESKKNYGGSVGKKSLEKYKYVILGHGHSFEVIPQNIMQLGSCRYIDFAEAEDKAKCVLLIENWREEKEKCHFLGIKSCFSMKDTTLSSKAQSTSSGAKSQAQSFSSVNDFCAYLDNLDSKTKVRVIFKDYEGYTQLINKLSLYKDKFVLFRIKKDFLIIEDNLFAPKQQDISLKESLIKYLEVNNVPSEIKTILLEEIK